MAENSLRVGVWCENVSSGGTAHERRLRALSLRCTYSSVHRSLRLPYSLDCQWTNGSTVCHLTPRALFCPPRYSGTPTLTVLGPRVTR
ncbi:hypothetical protein [Nannocystis pusilla]|uniref:hypothetical protein n=1 Tax=Nannocystis pusilla TaxID=889268 RepID=UPI003B7B97AE